MDRRNAIAGLISLGGVAAAPSIARAQAAKPGSRVIGYLSLERSPVPALTAEQWRGSPVSIGLRKLGWDEGRNLTILRAHAGLDVARLQQLAERLVRQRVEVIIASGPEAAVAAARASRRIAVVAFNLVWPEEQGLIRSFARPGRNVTGVSFYVGVETTLKRIELLREIVPAARRLSWLWPPDYEQALDGSRFDMAPAFDRAAGAAGFELRRHLVRSPEDIDRALGEVLAWPAQALSASGEHALREGARIAAFALQHRLPSAFPAPEFVESGGLFSYGISKPELGLLFSRTLEYVDRILRGARPDDLPVERPRSYELVVNMSTARALGLDLPRSLLVRADRVIG